MIVGRISFVRSACGANKPAAYMALAGMAAIIIALPAIIR